MISAKAQAKKMVTNLSRGVLPESLRRGPYAVVEQAERAKPFYLWGLGEVPPRLATFLDPCITEVKYHKDWLLFWTLVLLK